MVDTYFSIQNIKRGIYLWLFPNYPIEIQSAMYTWGLANRKYPILTQNMKYGMYLQLILGRLQVPVVPPKI